MCLNSWAGASIDIHVATHKRVCKMISPADMETQYCRYYNETCLLSIEQMRKCKIELRASISFCWVTSKQTETEPSKMVWRQEITKKCDFTSTTRHFFREFNISNGPQAPVQLELWNWMSRWKKNRFLRWDDVQFLWWPWLVHQVNLELQLWNRELELFSQDLHWLHHLTNIRSFSCSMITL